MKVERAQVEEVSVTYCHVDLREMLRYEDSDGVLKPIPEDAILQIVDDGLRVRFFREQTITNEIPGAVVDKPEEDSRFQYTDEEVEVVLPDTAAGTRALDIYRLMKEVDEPMTTKDISKGLTPAVNVCIVRKSLGLLRQTRAIECCGTRFPQVRDHKRLRRTEAWRPVRRTNSSVTSEE